MPPLYRKKPSSGRPPARKGSSAGSTSLSSSRAASASVRAIRSVGTSRTSAASRAATSFSMNARTAPPQPRRAQLLDELPHRDHHFPAEVAALLGRRELVLEVDRGRAGLD